MVHFFVAFLIKRVQVGVLGADAVRFLQAFGVEKDSLTVEVSGAGQADAEHLLLEGVAKVADAVVLVAHRVGGAVLGGVAEDLGGGGVCGV